jgi:Lon protease-like protein
MSYGNITFKAEQLPSNIPIFPLSGALLLPGIDLPLNIFEPRYINMVDDALQEKRLIGLVQPQQQGLFSKIMRTKPLFSTGCVGKIRAFNETEDGRYIIVLQGICRFELGEEISTMRGYRRFKADWSKYLGDLTYREDSKLFNVNKSELLDKVEKFLRKHGSQTSLSELKGLSFVNDAFLIDFLCSFLPFESQEKQLFLESGSIEDRIKILYKILGLSEAEIYIDNNKTIH